MGALWNMPLMDDDILAEDFQAATAVLDSISNRTICEDFEVRWGNVNWCDDCWDIGGGFSLGGIEGCSLEGGVGVKTWGLRPSRFGQGN